MLSFHHCSWIRTTLLIMLFTTLSAVTLADNRPANERSPLILGHRGAPGYLPEHTLESYALAIELGADFIEPDLVMTKDGYLIARHEPNIINTTDIRNRPEFAARKRVVAVDGVAEEGWFASDFTLAEIKTLRAIQAFSERPQQFNGKFEIPTLEEVIDLAKRKSKEKNRIIGIYPETKHPTYHRLLGLPLEPRLVETLKRAGWNHRNAPVFIQSFEQSNLQELRKTTPVRLIQLVDADDVNPDGSLSFVPPFDRPYDWTVSGNPQLLARTFAYFTTDAGLREVKRYADGIGPFKRFIVSTVMADLNNDGVIGDENGDGRINDADRQLLPANNLVQRAHQQGLLVHPYTFRNEQRRLAFDYAGNPVNEYLQFYRLGVDGVFSDFADTAFAARVLFQLENDTNAARCLTGDVDGPRRNRPDCNDD